MTTYDFGFGYVPAHRHLNGGGWVADTASVAETAYVGPNALVSGNAYLYLGRGITPGISSGDLWVNGDGSHTLRLGCWYGTTQELRELVASNSWPSGGDVIYRDRWSPSLLAVADLCDAQLSAWGAS